MVSCDGFGLLVRTLRGKRSRPKYGAAIGVSYSAVRKYETGEALPTWSVIAAMARDAGMDSDERLAFLDLILATATRGR